MSRRAPGGIFRPIVIIRYTPKWDPICSLCGLALYRDKLHICGQEDWVVCPKCGAKWNPGLADMVKPDGCGICKKV